MKQIITFIVLFFILSTTESKGQEISFKVNSEGVFKTSDNKDFIVIPAEGKTAKQLYDEVMYGISAIYKAPNKVIQNAIDSNTIVVNALVELLVESRVDVRTWYDFSYRLEFHFKAGKIKVNAPAIIGGNLRMGSLNNISYYPNNFVLLSLYETDKAKIPSVEIYFNDLLKEIITKKKAEDNW